MQVTRTQCKSFWLAADRYLYSNNIFSWRRESPPCFGAIIGYEDMTEVFKF